jgi:DNA-binding CsgD family transcriptional regulator
MISDDHANKSKITRNRDSRRNKATMVTILLRRQKIAELLQTSNKTTDEIGRILNVDDSTVSNDIKH